MKNAQNLVFKFATALILLLGIAACGGCEPVEPDDTVKADDVKEIIIPTDQAKELYDTYSERRVGLIRDFENAQDSLGTINTDIEQEQKEPTDQEGGEKTAAQKRMAQQESEGFQVVRYSFYDFESLKKYMAFIEQEAEKANVNISTLRFYFANYPDKDNFDNENPITEPRRNTLVFVPTVNTGKDEFAFFTADDSEDGQRKAYLLTEELEENGESYRGNTREQASLLPSSSLISPSSASMPAENRQSLAGNEGGLRPPK